MNGVEAAAVRQVPYIEGWQVKLLGGPGKGDTVRVPLYKLEVSVRNAEWLAAAARPRPRRKNLQLMRMRSQMPRGICGQRRYPWSRMHSQAR